MDTKKENMIDLSMLTRQPAYGGHPEAERLRRIHESATEHQESDWENEGGAVPPVKEE